MTDTFLHDLKQTLDNCISTLDSIHGLFCVHPGKDFSRDRKITFPLLCNALIQMQSKSLPNEDFLFHLFYDETLGCRTASTKDAVSLRLMARMLTYTEIPMTVKPLYMRVKKVITPST